MTVAEQPILYLDAGVDLDTADRVAAHITSRLGSRLFGGFVPISELKSYDRPVLVSSIDGIGTKVCLAASLDRVEGLGRDIVHHCVNDIAVHGAEPLFFLDYVAFHRLEPRLVERIVTSIADACDALGVRLAGGETAEMPLVYPPDHFDIAGAVVGAVDEADVIDGSTISAGDVLLGLPSNGLHTNGYSLIQRIFSRSDYDCSIPEIGETLGEALLKPHRCYLDDVRRLMRTGAIHGFAHITGGGIASNVSRIIPDGLTAVVELPTPPALFSYIESHGIKRDEMLRVFNMGIGLVAVCDPALIPPFTVIGYVEPGERRVVIHGSGTD